MSYVPPLLAAGVGLGCLSLAIAEGSTAAVPFQYGLAVALMLGFGFVWLFGIRYPDVGWMVVLTTSLATISWLALFADGERGWLPTSNDARFALMSAYGAYLLTFFRAPLPRGALEAAYAFALIGYYLATRLVPPHLKHEFGLVASLPHYLGATLLAYGALQGFMSMPLMPPKRQRYTLLVGIVSLVAAGSYLVAGRQGVASPWALDQACAAVFATFLVADLVIFHRNYYRDKVMRRDAEQARDAARHELGRSVQQVFLTKDRSGDFASFKYDYHFDPATAGDRGSMHTSPSSDWFDTWDLGGEKRFICGEVAGAEPQSALGIAAIVSCLHECKLRGLSLTETAVYLNARLVDLFDHAVTSSFMAVSVAADGTVEILNAGGAGFFVASRDGVHLYPLSSTPLGIDEDIEVATSPLGLDDGDLVFVLTGGLAGGATHVRRILDEFDARLDVTVELETIRGEVLKQARLLAKDDDKTMLTIQKRGA